MKHFLRKLFPVLCVLALAAGCVFQAAAEENRTDFNPVRLLSLERYANGKFDLTVAYMVHDTRSNRYADALYGAMDESDGSAYQVYDIGGRYHYFKATAAVMGSNYEIGENYSGIIRIYGDNRLLWSDENLKASGRPEEIQLDIRNVLDLKIEMYGQGNRGVNGVKVMLGNPLLLEDDPGFFAGAPAGPSEQAYAQATGLDTLSAYARGRTALGEDRSVRDVRGNEYAFALRGFMSPKDGTAFQVYDIGGSYQYFSATVAPQYSRNGIAEGIAGIIRIYGDGRLLWSDEEITSMTRPYEIAVYIGGVTDLKIEMYGWANSGSNGITTLLGNPVLLPPV